MARAGKQIQARLRRVELANRMLEWLKAGQRLEGNHTYEMVIVPFAKIEKTDLFEVWKAWDLLRKSGRRAAKQGNHFIILCTDPIKADQLGNIVGG